MPHLAAQLRAHFGWIDERLATGRSFMLGDRPGLPVEEDHPELGLHLLHLAAQGRLGHAQLRGSPAEVPVLVHGQDVLQLGDGGHELRDWLERRPTR